MTLDGVMEAPGYDEHPDGKNTWALQHATDDMQRYKIEELFAVDALLLGRVTYQIWAAFWPSAPRDLGFADRINALPKYVVSKTLKDVEWENSTLLSGDIVDDVRGLKEQPGGHILTSGSADLVDMLMEHDLIDEYRIAVYRSCLAAEAPVPTASRDRAHEGCGDADVRLGDRAALRARAGDADHRYVDSFAWTKEQIRSLDAAQNVDRVLATVLFTDIVDSSGQAAALGDREWRKLLDRHDRAVRTEVERFHGRLVKTTGDGILATFDAPTRALRCAFGLIDAIGQLGLRIRAAVHTGEIEILDEDVGGIGVHIAARVLGEASDDQVVVTRTVRELATGTDLVYDPLGTVHLRGIPGDWELFSASTP
jgi:class 3 adenylate cyclase/dihydrofolate reductase